LTEPCSRSPGLPRVFGHDESVARIREAIHAGRLPQALLLHGAAGVGKRTVALWIAASIACEQEDAPCGACRSCRLARRLEHPDIHIHFPMPRPKRASSPAKLRDAIETQRQERLAALRKGARLPDEDTATGIYLAAVEGIRAQASRRPAMGRRVVFVVVEADRMVPQRASPEAANALLKLLEEPPEFAHVILTSSRRSALLPTILSRTTSLRLAPIAEGEVARCLTEELGVAPEAARVAARRSGGSVGSAVRLLETDDDAPGSAADRMLIAALRGDAALRYRVAGSFGASGGRAVLAPALETLGERLRDLLCHVSGAEGLIRDPGAITRIPKIPAVSADGLLAALGAVDAALDCAHKNLNPQSTVSVLLSDMGGAFVPEDGR